MITTIQREREGGIDFDVVYDQSSPLGHYSPAPLIYIPLIMSILSVCVCVLPGTGHTSF